MCRTPCRRCMWTFIDWPGSILLTLGLTRYRCGAVVLIWEGGGAGGGTREQIVRMYNVNVCTCTAFHMTS